MANVFKGCDSHSAEYFGDTRDYWYDEDFLWLMAERWRLGEVREVLDVGCGVGHWGRALARVLPGDATIEGVDRDAFWVEQAARRAGAIGQGGRFRYRVGLAERLPFGDDTFDLVTCQTVLIHSPDPRRVLAEMMRVTKPGGLVAVAEPNNAANALVLDAASFRAPVDEIVELTRLQLVCERGKEALGEGNNSIGDVAPSLFAELGFVDVRAHLNDKAALLLPPYESPEARALADEAVDFAERDFWIWSRAETLRYFVAGGGREVDFAALWATAIASQRRALGAIKAGAYAKAGGGVTYLVSGRKRATLAEAQPVFVPPSKA
jgi:SAM-dependent methyltransferase